MCALASMYANFMCCRAFGLFLIAVVPLFGDSDLLIARCQKEWFFLIVDFEPVSYHRDDQCNLRFPATIRLGPLSIMSAL